MVWCACACFRTGSVDMELVTWAHGFSGPFLDVKPSNMLVNTGGQVKLCDFGVSTQVGLFPPDLFSSL